MTPITIDGRDYIKCEASENKCDSQLVGFEGKAFECALYYRQSCQGMECRDTIYLDDTPEFGNGWSYTNWRHDMDYIPIGGRADEPHITVEIKQVYGRETIYPYDNRAKLFANMLGQTTLTRANIDYIKALGFTVRVHHHQETL